MVYAFRKKKSKFFCRMERYLCSDDDDDDDDDDKFPVLDHISTVC
jgi:hypothetical protein